MTTGSEELSPLTEQGELALPAAGGRWGRRRVPEPAAPSVEPGLQLVWLAPDGSARLTRPTAGERRFGEVWRWVKIDLRPTSLTFQLPLQDYSGRIGLQVTVGIEASVHTESVLDVARRGVGSARGLLLARIQTAVSSASEAIESAKNPEADTVSDYARARARAESEVRKKLSEQLPERIDWLHVVVSSVEVSLDAETAQHVRELVDGERATEVQVAVASRDLDIRDLYRKRLLPHLTDPEARSFEEVMANPTSENIARAVGQAEGKDQEMAGHMLELIQLLLDKNYIDKADPLYGSVTELVGVRLKQLGNSGRSTAALTSGGTASTEAPSESPSDDTFGDIPVVELDDDHKWTPDEESD